MDQATFEFDPARADACDATGFQIGWDHAHHGLVPPPGLLLDGTPIGHGWRAGKAVFGHRTLPATRPVRSWLALRTDAWRRSIAFESLQLTPNYLAQIDASQCPVTRAALGGTAETAPVFARLNEAAGYAAGNVATVSALAAAQLGMLAAGESLRRAARVEAGIEEPPAGLSVDATWRLAVLASFATPLPFAEAARIPLRVLPPNRVRLLNSVQGLQALVTRLFTTAGWTPRVRAFADLLPHADLRHEFHFWVGALAPRLPSPNGSAAEIRRALEDAWACPRVGRRWHAFALALGAAGTDALLERAAAAGLTGVRTIVLAPAQATEGWSLASRGRLVTDRLPRRRPPAAPAPLQRGA